MSFTVPARRGAEPSRSRSGEPRGSDDDVAVHLPERIADQLQAGAVGIREVDRAPVDVGVRDVRRVELVLEVLPPARLDGDGEVVEAAEHLRVRSDVETGQVEEGERVAIADVEEEVRRALV